MLMPQPTQLPSIDERHAAQIESKFVYGLHLAEVFGNPIPDGTFYGQRLVREHEVRVDDSYGRTSSWTRSNAGKPADDSEGRVLPAKLVIKPGDPRKNQPGNALSGPQRDTLSAVLAPAITLKGAKPGKRKVA